MARAGVPAERYNQQAQIFNSQLRSSQCNVAQP
jgi:hypothetical protein